MLCVEADPGCPSLRGAVVLEGLQQLDYHGVTAVILDGADRQIDAGNRDRRPVRLFASARTGLLRGRYVLPTFE